MAKRDRKKDKSEIEHFRGEIREKEKLIKQLLRRLKHFEKRDHLNDRDATPTEPVEPEAPKLRCEACGKGHYNVLDLGQGRVYLTCSIPECGDRKRK